MATTGEISFTQASTTNEAPHLDEPWINPTNALVEDGADASVTAATFDTGDQTAILRTFDASASLTAALPSDLISVDGVIVRINGYSDSATLVDFDLVQLLDAVGALSGDNLASPSVQMGLDTAAIHVFGSSSEKWGLGAGLTRDLLIDPQFGVGIGVLAQTNNSQCFVDYVSIEVFYTGQPPPPPPTPETAVPIVSVTTVA
jgi:hypothetical protein